MSYFDIKCDGETIAAGGFWCSGCLTGKPAIEQSDDPRYCHFCFKNLLNESALLPASRGKPGWIPSPGHALTLPAVEKPTTKLSTNGVGSVGVMLHAGGRPRKEGKVSRMTEWRRNKLQGVLV